MTDDFNYGKNETNGGAVNLADYDEEFEEVEVPEGGGDFPEIPDGKYQASIEEIKPKKSQAGKDMIEWTLCLLNSKHVGQKLWKFSMLPDSSMDAEKRKNRLKYLAKDLALAGLDLKAEGLKFSQLEDNLHRLLDVRINIQKKTKDGFANIYINGVIDGDVASGSGNTTPTNSAPITGDVDL